MKKTIIRILVLCIFLCMLPVLALAESWACEACGTENTMKFCGNCGAEKPKWICAECEAKNDGSACAECGLSQEASEILTKYDVAVYVGVYPILENGEYDGAIRFIPCTETVYTGDCTVDAHFFPVVRINNKTDETHSFTTVLTIENEKASWSDKEISGNGEKIYYMNSFQLTAGTFEYKLYINSIEVTSGQYNLVAGKSDKPEYNSTVNARVQIRNQSTGELLKSRSTLLFERKLKEGEEYVPVLHLSTVPDDEGRSIAVGAIINNTDSVAWNDYVITFDKDRNFYWESCPMKEGINSIVWFVDGQEVARDTFIFIADPNKEGE